MGHRAQRLRRAAVQPRSEQLDVIPPQLYAVVSVWCLSKYQLNRERHQEILKALEARRAERADRDRGEAVTYS